MRRRSVVLLSLVPALAVSGYAGSRMAVPMARPGLGYVAKVVCSNVFVGGVEPGQALADLPDEPIAKLVRTHVDDGARSVTASIPLVARRQAVYRDGLGCTLEPAAATTPPLSNAAAAPFAAAAPAPVSAAAPASAATAAAPPASAPSDSALSWSVDPSNPRTAGAIDTARLNAAIADAFAEPDPSLMRKTRAIVVVVGGRVVAERYADGYSATSRFAGWSMTKSVTNALVGILSARQALEIGADNLLPEWRSPSDARAAITLHDLLTMSSGLGFSEDYSPSGAATRMLFDADDAAAVASASPLVHEPGTTWSYSSATTNIISSLIRATLGSDPEYIGFPRHALFDRIGMASAVLEPDPSGTFVGSSFMYATARDWARFGLLFLRDGVWNGERILPEGWVDYSVTPTPAAPLGQYGAHWWLNAGEPTDRTRRLWPDLPADIFFASGFEGQYIAIVPSRDLVVVRLGVTPDDRAWRLGSFLRAVIGSVE